MTEKNYGWELSWSAVSQVTGAETRMVSRGAPDEAVKKRPTSHEKLFKLDAFISKISSIGIAVQANAK